MKIAVETNLVNADSVSADKSRKRMQNEAAPHAQRKSNDREEASFGFKNSVILPLNFSPIPSMACNEFARGDVYITVIRTTT